MKFNSFVMFAVCSLLFSIVLLFPVLEARIAASRKKLGGGEAVVWETGTKIRTATMRLIWW